MTHATALWMYIHLAMPLSLPCCCAVVHIRR
jgi:hypothetical protein